MDIIPWMKDPSEMPLISVVIPNYNGAFYLETCLRSLTKQTYTGFEVIVVDNASEDESVRIAAKSVPGLVLLAMTQNLGFAGAVNEGIREAHGEWVAVLNNDTEADPEWLARCMAAAANHPEASFLACRIMDIARRDRIYGAGDCFLRAGIGYRLGQEIADRGEYHTEREVFSPCGCAALYRRSVLREMGGFDERFFAYLEDVELGLRMQAAAHRGWYVPDALVYHCGGATSGGEFSPLAVQLRTRNALLLLAKTLPGEMIRRCAFPILFAQLFWFLRVIAHGRLWSFLRGLSGAARLAPVLLREKKESRRTEGDSDSRLWDAILLSESMARADVAMRPKDRPSIFLKWYFRLF